MKIELDITDEQLKEIMEKYGQKEEIVRFKPKHNGSYYYINLSNKVECVGWNDDSFDKGIYKLGNVFGSKEDAEFALNDVDTRMNNLIIQWKLKFDRFVPDWEDKEQEKHYIHIRDNKFITKWAWRDAVNIPYFSSNKNAKACIKWLKGVL